MTTKKITITLPEETLARLRAAATTAGIPLSTYISQVTEHHARIQDGLAEMREWEFEHGEFTEDELARADAEIARAEAGMYHSPPSTARAS